MTEPHKVPPPRSQAGPGCWQCADCGLIVGDDKETCPRCNDTETDESDQSSLAGFGAGGQSKLIDLDN